MYKFHPYLLYSLIVILGFLGHSSNGQQTPCELNLVVQPPDYFRDNAQQGDVVYTADPVLGIVEDITLIPGEDGHGDHSANFNFAIATWDDEDGQTWNTVSIVAGPNFRNYVDINPRSVTTRTYFEYRCGGVTYQNLRLAASWQDVNTRGPTFENLGEVPVQFNLPPTWDRSVPINWNLIMQVGDEDYDFANTRFDITSSPTRILRVVQTPEYSIGDPIPRPKYLTNLGLFLNDDYQVTPGSTELVTLTVTDGVHPPSLLDISLVFGEAVEVSQPPKFGETYYSRKLTDWPEVGDIPVFDNGLIMAGIEGNTDGVEIMFEIPDGIGLSDYLEFAENPPNPENVVLRFTRAISEEEAAVIGRVLLGVIKAYRSDDNTLAAEVPLIIELPEPTVLQFPVFSETFFHSAASWDVPEVVIPNVFDNTQDPPPSDIRVSLRSTYPVMGDGQVISLPYLSETNEIRVEYENLDLDDYNGVLLIEVGAQIGDNVDTERRSTIALYFPMRQGSTSTTLTPSTAEPVTPCPICECSTVTTEDPSSTSTTEQSSTTPDYSICPSTPEPEPPEECPPCTTTTVDPQPSTGTTECSTPSPCEPCPTTECPASPTTVSDCPTPTVTTCEPCDPTSSCPSSPTTESECPSCPTTEQPIITSTVSECPTTPTCEPCNPTTTTTTCEPCLECPSTECPPISGPTLNPVTTQNPVPTLSPIPDDDDDDCECPDNETAYVASVAATSAVALGSAGVATFLFFKLKAATALAGVVAASSGGAAAAGTGGGVLAGTVLASSATTAAATFGGKGDGSGPGGYQSQPAPNPSKLEEVITHSSPKPKKSNLAKPKEIEPDYPSEDHLSTSSSTRALVPDEDELTTPKVGGVKISDEVEIIDHSDMEEVEHL